MRGTRSAFSCTIVTAMLILASAVGIPPAGAQVGSMRVTLGSPTAASLGKVGDVPVSMYTGVPDIAIPLFTVQGRTLSLPITARYHAGGIRVEEVGGWLGIGWALEAGGTITRTVRGLVDESTNGYFNTGHNLYTTGNWPNPPQTLVNNIENEVVDGEPDQFFFSFAGRSGQFVMGPTTTSTSIKQFRTIPHQKLRITPNISGGSIASWVLQTEDGTRYTFGVAETNTDFNVSSPSTVIPPHFGDTYTTTWHLTQVKSPGGDIITFTYTPYTTRFRIGGYKEQFDQVVSPPGQPACVPALYEMTNEYQVAAQRLTTITSAAHTVRFVTTLRTDALSPTGTQQEHRLDSMVVSTSGSVVLRRFRFEHDYSNGRLTLKNIYENDRNNVSLPPHTFTYTGGSFPAYSSFALDHWGFYNGKTSNITPIPGAVTPSGAVLSGADRRPDSVTMKTGVLSRITYPTGGYHEFIFEANDYGGVGSGGTLPIDQGPQQFIQARSDANQGVKFTPFTVGGTQTVVATVTVTLNPQCGPAIGCPYATIPGKGMWLTSGIFQVSLAPGSYTAEASEEFSGGFALITVEWSELTSVKRKVGGGLRIAELRTVDAMGNTTYRKYRYRLQSDTARSSGVMSSEPAYSFQYTSSCSYFSRSSQSRMPLGGGPVVGYSEATMSLGASGQFGSTRYRFRSVLNADDDPPSTANWPYSKRTSREWKRGQSLSVEERSATAQVQQRTATSYTFRDVDTPDTVTTRNFRGLSIHSFSAGQVGSTLLTQAFEVISAWAYPVADTTVQFDTTGTSSFTSVRSYTRANSTHLEVTEAIETNSDGTQRVTRTRYPADYSVGSGNVEAVALSAMRDTINMHGVPIEQWVIKRSGGIDSVLRADLTTFKLFTPATTQYLAFQRFAFRNSTGVTNFVPAAVSGSFTKDSRYVAEETANTYDAFGRITQLADARGKITNYLYGGNANNAFLVKVTKVKDGTGTIDLVTDATYDTDGFVSSIKDEGGSFRYFAYDLFGRLRTIRNHGNVAVKSYGYTYSRTSPSWVFNAAAPNAVVDSTWIQSGVSVTNVQYLDGLGRPIQSVLRDGASFYAAATQYDLVGRPWRTWKPYAKSSAAYDASYSTNATTFYNTYHSTSLAKPYVETLYRPDVLGRVSRVIPEFVGSSATAIALQNYGVDVGAKQLVAELVDESGKKTRSFTDVFGYGVKTTLGFGAAEATTTVLASNVLGQRTRATDPRGLQTNYTLDTRGLLTTRISPDAGTVSSKYDLGRNLRFAQDANQAAAGKVAFASYDFANRPLVSGEGTATFSALDPDAAPGTLETTNTNWLTVRAYDAKPATASFPWSRFSTQISAATLVNVAGRLAAVANKSNGAWQVTLFSYDTDGRVASRLVYTEANGGASVLTALNTTVTYVRDLRDAITERHVTVGATGFHEWYDYNGRGLLWKAFASTTTTKPGTPDVTYTYRPSGEVQDRLFQGGSSVPLRYTIREQLERIGDPATTTYPFSARYTYHANGTISEGEFYSAGSPAAQKRYRYQYPTYDALNRLKAADYSGWNGSAWATTLAYDLTGINYDLNGNLTGLQRYKETAALVDNLTYTIAGTSNRLTALADAVGATGDTWDAEAGAFTYDANGNQLTAPGPYSLTASTYDPRNLPLSVTKGGVTTSYRYDDGGQRITKQVVAGNTEVYLRDGATTLGVFTVSGAGAVVSSFFNLHAGDRIVGRQPSTGSRVYYHTDLLGSTRAVVQGATVVESYDYDPWGVLLPGRTLGSGTKEGFTSKERDPETGLDYFGARLYASAFGRWTTVDPPQAGDATPEWSVYAYVRNDPVRSVDLFGLMGCTIRDQSQCKVFTGADAQAAFRQLQRTLPAAGEAILASGKFTLTTAATGVLGEAVAGIAASWLGQAVRATKAAALAAKSTASLPKYLYSYTDDATAALVEKSQLGLPGRTTYLTPQGGLSPLQAQIELALPQKNTATSLFRISTEGLDPSKVILQRRVTGNVFNRGGGGTEILFDGPIPLENVTRLK